MANTDSKRLAILWDMDGVLVDTDSIHMEAYSETLKAINRGPIAYDDIRGQTTRSTFEKLGFKEPLLSELVATKQKIARSHLKSVQAFSGAKELVAHMRSLHYFQGVVTGASRHFANEALTMSGIHPYVNLCVTAESDCLSKPNPDPFLMAVKQNDLLIEHCVVVEDSLETVLALADFPFKNIFFKTNSSESALPHPIKCWSNFETLGELMR